MIRLVLAGLAALSPGAALACFSISTGDEYWLTGPELLAGQSFEVEAGGDQPLASCGLPLFGYVELDPNFSFYLSEMEGLSLEARVDGDCDTLLVLHGGNLDFFADDDSGGDLNPLVVVPPGPTLTGRLNVWVGTYGPDRCPAVLRLRAVQE